MSASSGVVVLGFIPLLDCAPLVAAAEWGFAADVGIELMLVRETSSANIRDRVVVGHLDAAHMLGRLDAAQAKLVQRTSAINLFARGASNVIR